MKVLTPIEVVAQVGLNRVAEEEYRALRSVVQQKLLDMYPNRTPAMIADVISRAISKRLVWQDGDFLVVR